MDKYSRSSRLFDAVQTVEGLGNAWDQEKSMDQIYRETAKKFNLDEKLLRQAMENPEIFEPLKLPKSIQDRIDAQKIAKPATTAINNVAGVNNKLYEELVVDAYAKPYARMINTVAGVGNKIDDYLKKQSAEMAKAAEKNIVKAGSAGKVLRGLGKVAGPVGAALTAAEMGGALAELRKLGAEKIAEENEVKESEKTGESVEFKGPYTPEERMRLKEMLKQLRGSASLRK